MTRRRRRALAQVGVYAGTAASVAGGYLGSTALWGLGAAAALCIPLSLVRVRGTGRRRAPAPTHTSPAAPSTPTAPNTGPHDARQPDPDTTLPLPIHTR
jgi:hypothetical protein